MVLKFKKERLWNTERLHFWELLNLLKKNSISISPKGDGDVWLGHLALQQRYLYDNHSHGNEEYRLSNCRWNIIHLLKLHDVIVKSFHLNFYNPIIICIFLNFLQRIHYFWMTNTRNQELRSIFVIKCNRSVVGSSITNLCQSFLVRNETLTHGNISFRHWNINIFVMMPQSPVAGRSITRSISVTEMNIVLVTIVLKFHGGQINYKIDFCYRNEIYLNDDCFLKLCRITCIHFCYQKKKNIEFFVYHKNLLKFFFSK